MVLFIYNMKYTHIIWDFNGTILNDIDVGIAAVNAVLKNHNKKTIDDVDFYRRAFCFPVIDYYDSIGLERENFHIYAPEWVNEYNKREPEAPIFDGVEDLMKYLRDNGYKQYLLSATEREMLEKQVDRLEIKEYFHELIGQDTIEAHSKKSEAILWASREMPERPLMIGDTLHDFEVATAINADCILLAYGHQNKERLRATGCRVFDDIKDVHNAFINGEL